VPSLSLEIKPVKRERVLHVPTNKEKTTRRLKIMGMWMIILSLFISELMVYTWARVQCVNVGYEINDATGKNIDLKAVQKNIQIELARLKSPERISKIAEERLSLTTPTPEQVIVVQ